MRTVVTFALFCLLARGEGKLAAKPAPRKLPRVNVLAGGASDAALAQLAQLSRGATSVMGAYYGDAPGARSKESIKFRHWVKDLHIGGFIMVNRVQKGLARTADQHTLALFFYQMQKLSKTPLLIGADFERGSSMRVSDTVRYPFNMAYAAARDVDASRAEGVATAREARALGVQWVFAPDADVNNNPLNPVINIRSYGENPQEVSEHVAAYIDGAHYIRMRRISCWFRRSLFSWRGMAIPTSTYSHLDLARLDATREHMNDVELKPFEAAINHGVDSIMTAHLTVPAIEPDAIPATVSARVLTGLLREDLGFKGLVVTDAMDMAGLTKQFATGEASVRAIQAGADVLLMPADPGASIRALMAAVAQGRISRQRIDQSALQGAEDKSTGGVAEEEDCRSGCDQRCAGSG